MDEEIKVNSEQVENEPKEKTSYYRNKECVKS